VVRLALSRSRKLMADSGSVELTKDANAMISALRKIENELPGATSAVMEMCVNNPRQGFAACSPLIPRSRRGCRAGDICRRPRSRPDATSSA
jgi:Zn-dependent protease with chaperone function